MNLKRQQAWYEGGFCVDKKTLMDYVDTCELIKETEYEINRMRKIEMEHAKVVGSNPEFPYQKKSFHVSGVTEIYLNQNEINKEKEILYERKKRAKNLKHEIEKWMNTIPSRMQRIVRMKYFEGKSWEEIAVQMGRKATADSVRKEFDRVIRKK